MAGDKTGAARSGGAPGSGCKDWAHAGRGARMLGSDLSKVKGFMGEGVQERVLSSCN